MKAAPILIAVLGMLIQTGCASIMNGKTQKVRIESDPTGAEFVIYPSGEKATTPASIELARNKPYTVRLQFEGYEKQTVLLNPILSNWLMGNILIGGLIGLSVDTGAPESMKLVPNAVKVELAPVRLEPGRPDDLPPKRSAPLEPTSVDSATVLSTEP